MSSRRVRMGLIGSAVAALLLAAAISLPAFGGSGKARQSSVTKDAAKALQLAQDADKRSKDASALVPASGPGGGEGAKGQKGAQGPTGAQGANGANGVNGTNGPNGANGGKGAAGADGSPGANGDVRPARRGRAARPAPGDRRTGRRPGHSRLDGDTQFVPSRRGEWLIAHRHRRRDHSATCAGSGASQVVVVLIDDEPPNSTSSPGSCRGHLPLRAAPGPPIDFSRRLDPERGTVPPTGSDDDRGTSAQGLRQLRQRGRFRLPLAGQRVRVTVAGTGPPPPPAP